MIDPNTPAGTKVLCVDVQGCFSSCNCDGNHPLGPLIEGRIYTLLAVNLDSDDVRATAGYCVRVDEIDRSNADGEDPGYAPQRFIALEPKWQASRRTDRAPIRSKKLEEA